MTRIKIILSSIANSNYFIRTKLIGHPDLANGMLIIEVIKVPSRVGSLSQHGSDTSNYHTLAHLSDHYVSYFL